jgi:glycosyltransferase involved in cell wall biosynthesis
MGTTDRPLFLQLAVQYFLRQSYPNRELIIIDDGPKSENEARFGAHNLIKYIKLKRRTSLGRKLNIGIEAARGSVIQKLDDDDYYDPNFLDHNVRALLQTNDEHAMVGYQRFLVLILQTAKVKDSGGGWFAGGTICFFKQLWKAGPFREDMNGPEDYWFIQYHQPLRILLDEPERYIHVRHDIDHLWTKLHDEDVTTYFSRRPDYSKPINDILTTQDVKFYEQLHHNLLSQSQI